MRKTGLLGASALTLAAVFGMSGMVAAQRPGKQKPRQVPETGVEKVQTPADVAGEALLEQMTSRSSADLVEVVRADGAVAMDLEGRFMNVMLATPTADGGMAIACETGAEALKNAASPGRPATDRTTPAAPVSAPTAARELK